MRSRLSCVAGCPRISMVPESGPRTFMIMRRVVVLPAPLGPRRPKAAPRGTARERSSTATCPEKALLTPERRMASSLTPVLSARASRGRRVYHRAFAGTSPGKERGVAEASTVPRSFRFGVQAKLLAVVLLCVVVPVLTLGLFLLRRNQEVLREKVEDGLSSHLLRRQSAFDDWMRDRAQEATRWSASFVVYEGLDAFAKEAPESRAARDLKSYLASLLGHYRVYESLFIVDGEGRVLTGTREEQLEDWARPLVQGEVSFDGVLVSPLRKSQLLGRPTQLLLRPIPPPGTTERRGRALGYFVERFDLRELESMLAEDATDLAPAPWLLDAEGHILARAGKVVDDAGLRPFPLPAASGSSSGPGSFVAQGTLPEIGPSVFGVRNLTGGFPGPLVAPVPTAPALQALTAAP